MSIFHQDTPDNYTLVENVKTQSGARTMALDQKDWQGVPFRCGIWPRPAATPAARSVGRL